MTGDNKVRVITCVICTKFCQNRDEERLNNLIRGIKEEGFEPIFSCNFLKNNFAEK